MRGASSVRKWTPRWLRNAARSPAATATWLWDEALGRLGRTIVVEPRQGWSLRCHPACREAFRAHAIEQDLAAELEGFLGAVAPSMVLLDVGAHYGIFTLAALHFGGAGARAVCVEPSPAARRVLQSNLAAMGAADRVVIVDAAAGTDGGSLDMLTTGPFGAHYFVVSPTQRPDTRTVPTMGLRTLAGYAPGAPTHLKVDVEGAEHEILEDVEFLREIRPLLFLELHGDILRSRGVDPSAVLARLRLAGYQELEWHGLPISPDDAAAMGIARLICRPGSA